MAKAHKTIPSSGGGAAQQIRQMTTVATAYATAYQKAIAMGVGATAAAHGAVLAASMAAINTSLSQNQINAAIAQGAQTAQGAQAAQPQQPAAQAQAAPAQPQVAAQKSVKQKPVKKKANQAAQPQQQAAQQTTPQQTQTPANATSRNGFVDTNSLPDHPTFKDIPTLLNNFLSASTLDKVSDFINTISDSDLNLQNGKVTSQWLAAEKLGFNGLPTLHDHVKSLTQQDPDRVVMFRGIFGNGQLGAQYAEQFKTGDRFASKGVYGDGDYFQTSYSGAEYYATHSGVGAFSVGGKGTNGNVKGSIVTASFNPKKARIIKSDTLYALRQEICKNIDQKKYPQIYNLLQSNHLTSNNGKIRHKFETGSDGVMGTLATMLGYDAIYEKGGGGSGNDYYAILNRKILDVKKGY